MKRLMMMGLIAGLCALPTLAQEGMPEMPKPTAEHAMLAKDAGEWDAAVKMWMDPSQPATESKGTEKVSMIGPFWQVSRYKGSMMGQEFTGLGMVGWDASKKHYITSWIDSMTPSISHGTGSYDAATRTFTGTMDGMGPDGKPVKMSQKTVWKGDDTRVFTMGMPGPDGKEFTTMEITYTRKK